LRAAQPKNPEASRITHTLPTISTSNSTVQQDGDSEYAPKPVKPPTRQKTIQPHEIKEDKNLKTLA
jgi:hypothetical protein